MPTMDIIERAFDTIRQGANHVTDSIRQLLQRQAQNNEGNENELQGSATDGQAGSSDINGGPSTSVHSLPPHYDEVPILQPALSYNSIYRFFGGARSSSAWTLPNMRPPAYVSHDALPAYSSSVREEPQRGGTRPTWRSITDRITFIGPLPRPSFLTFAIYPRSSSAGPSTPHPPTVIIQPIEFRPRRLDILPARWKLGWVVGGGLVLTGLGVVFWMAEQSWQKKKDL